MKRYLALKASAGSGKTFALVVRYISLLLGKAEVSQILAITFTVKASTEMRNKIEDVLINLDKPEYKKYIDEISKSTNYNQNQVIKKRDEIIKQFLSYEPQIMTIDKFLNKILRLFCWYAGLNQNFIIKKQDEAILKTKFLQSLTKIELEQLTNFLASTNSYFSTMWNIFEILDDKSSNISIKKLDNIDLSVKELLDTAFKIKTFVLDSNASDSAKKSVDFDCLDTLFKKGKTWLTKDSLKEFSYFKKIYKKELDDHFYRLKKLIYIYFKNKEMLFLSTIYKFFKYYKTIKNINIKTTNNLSFVDVSNFVFMLMKTRIDNEFLYFRLDSKISHLLIDEFQDTSLLQFYILRPIIDEILSQYSSKSLFYVGDPKQSIYRFRGGHSELFNYVSDTYEDRIVVDYLKTNYRSADIIVNFVNQIFMDKIDDYLPQIPYKKNNDGYVEVDFCNDILEDLKKKLILLKKKNIAQEDIAILTFENKDLLVIKEFLNKELPDIDIFIQTNSYIINRANIKAMIYFIKYIYFDEEFYKLYFLELLGLEDITKQTKNLTIDMPLDLIVMFLIDEYSLYDENALKFLEEIYEYEDISQFVYEIDMLETQVASQSDRGVELMTIHRSKGLEFLHVILVDRLNKKKSNRDIVLYDYNNVHIEKIFYKFNLREFFDDKYKTALQKEKNKQYIDNINLLYVGFTRAKQSLIILQKNSSSQFDILKLKEIKIGNIKVFSKKKIDKKENIKILQNIYYGKQSEFVTHNKSYTKNIDYKDINFGLAVHYAFENLDLFLPNSIQNSIDLVLNKFGIYIDDIKEIENILKSTITDNSFIKLISGTIYKEYDLFDSNQRFTVDVIVEHKNFISIIDFKTSSPDSAYIYYNQIKEYKKISSKEFNKKAKGYLCFVSQNAPVIVDV